MYAYNVTVNIDSDVHDEWLKWMKEVHIPQVMATGLFESSKMFRLLTREEDESGTTYAIQYFCKDLESYDRYQADHAASLQAETRRLYEGKFAAFRSLMEEV
jgi:hypothetical protein